MKNKKATIGSTFTWVAAFLIIFFVILLFLSATTILAGKKYLSGEKNKIIINDLSGSLEEKNLLVNVLNLNVVNKTIFELVNDWGLEEDFNKRKEIKEKIQENVEKFLETEIENNEFEKYFFSVVDFDGGAFSVPNKNTWLPDDVSEIKFNFDEEEIEIKLAIK